jgi:hypothetical protein
VRVRAGVTLVLATSSAVACSVFGDFSDFSGGAADADSGSTSDGGIEGGGDASDGGGASDAPSDVALLLDGGECDPSAVLLGTNEIGETDTVPSNTLDMYGYAPKATGLARCVWIYLANAPSSPELRVGVFGNNAPPSPGTLLAKAKFAPKQGWNVGVLDTPLMVTTNTSAWIGVLPLGGGVVDVVTSRACTGVAGTLRAMADITDLPATAVTNGTNPGYCNAAMWIGP